ncbi:hypothetical protein HYW41_02595 [Candidatus Daviesbacteria bacterium]|nr:hypothetical protein [Candidatus Daviesbacteria bacterium]
MRERGSVVVFALIVAITISAIVGGIFYLTDNPKNTSTDKDVAITQSQETTTPIQAPSVAVNQQPAPSSEPRVSQEPGPITNDAILPPGSLKDVQLVINFGQGKKYEALQDVIYAEEKTPLGLLKGNRFGIKREMKFDKFYADELIVVDKNNNLQSIGDYKNDYNYKWVSYVNSKAVSNQSTYPLQDKDLVEWIYGTK